MRDRSAPLTAADLGTLDWAKMAGLIPALVQDARGGQVLMLGYVNQEALGATFASGFVTFFSRSRQQLWQKGETSGNRLKLVGAFADCDDDALLILVDPEGPVCHLGTQSCFGAPSFAQPWFSKLSGIIAERARSGGSASYTRKLLDEGAARIGQKIGEEGVELALAAVGRDRDGCIDETADLIYHLAVLMEARGFTWDDVAARLEDRHAAAAK
jgi:phosphoribosyl-ATP pyrophosphohydrolase/phosphoribosyl-AMP cyclohydrolase